MSAERPAPGVAAYATGVLFAVNVVGYLDRQILNLLVQPIKASLHLSDGQIGLMQGLAFVLTFTVAGLFIGRLVDRINRRNLLLVCVAIWSVCAAAGGLVQSGGQLFLARMGVGIGEAALIPVAVSMIADYFDPAKRGRAYGLFTTGIYAGSGLSLILVAFALPAVKAWAAELATEGHAIEPWRIVMGAMIVPGILCCALLLTLPEPDRATAAPSPAAPSPATIDTRAGAGDWLQGWKLFLPHHVSLGLATFALYAVAAWMPTVLIRDHGFEASKVGLVLGVQVTITGMLGAYLGGVAADRGAAASGVRGRLVATAFAMAIGCAGSLLISAPALPMALAGAALVTAGLGASIVAGIQALSDLSPARSRGRITAIYFVFTGVIGAAGGPAVIGYANDAIGKLGLVLAAGCAITSLGALALAMLTVRQIGPAGQATTASLSGAAS